MSFGIQSQDLRGGVSPYILNTSLTRGNKVVGNVCPELWDFQNAKIVSKVEERYRSSWYFLTLWSLTTSVASPVEGTISYLCWISHSKSKNDFAMELK